jgi:hypothetical protein
MSHSGNRAFKYRRVLTNPKPAKVSIEDRIINKGGKLEEQKLIGELQGNGITVLVGLSTSPQLDITNILNDNEKGVIIGYTPNSPYFELFRNDGLGPKDVRPFVDKFKDEQYHDFILNITTDNKLLVTLDGADLVFTTKIPSNTDTLYIINYSIY